VLKSAADIEKLKAEGVEKLLAELEMA
jgi:hypothetical protein